MQLSFLLKAALKNPARPVKSTLSASENPVLDALATIYQICSNSPLPARSVPKGIYLQECGVNTVP